MWIRTLTTICLEVRVNVGIQTIVYIFKSVLFHSQFRYEHIVEVCELNMNYYIGKNKI